MTAPATSRKVLPALSRSIRSTKNVFWSSGLFWENEPAMANTITLWNLLGRTVYMTGVVIPPCSKPHWTSTRPPRFCQKRMKNNTRKMWCHHVHRQTRAVAVSHRPVTARMTEKSLQILCREFSLFKQILHRMTERIKYLARVFNANAHFITSKKFGKRPWQLIVRILPEIWK